MGNLDTRLSGKIGLKIVIYYMGTTVLAIILGIILVLTIQPGSRSNEETDDLKPQRANITTTDTVLDLIRYLDHQKYF
jgi:Na+/H+-dicarboxylate symporter